jgi:elongation factor G
VQKSECGTRENAKSNEAVAPLSEVMQYQSQPKSAAGGQGSSVMELSHYDPVSPNMQAQIVSQYKPKADED